MADQIKATDLFSNWAKEGKDQRRQLERKNC